jgi:cation diffusion facilitator CzcD-associated flavoprotein CzcO
MDTWLQHMPDGMLLKSDGFASNLSTPGASFRLKEFCEAQGIAYDDMGIPIQLETFRAYGLAFQKHMVPDLEDKQVIRIERQAGAYRLHLDDGESVTACQVVLAVGIGYFRHVPTVLQKLPDAFLSHSSVHREFGRFRGRDVAVIGGGASAIDVSVLLKEAGANPSLIARRKALKFADPPDEARSLWRRMRRPRSSIGEGWRSCLYAYAPWAFHHFPQAVRLRVVSSYLGPAAGWPMKTRFVERVPALMGFQIRDADVRHGRVRLSLDGPSGLMDHATDHVVAATGYRVDLRRLTFLSEDLLSAIRSVQHTPLLSSAFESSVPGLYFAGVVAANSFGPVLRFVCGADWTARRICRAASKHVRFGSRARSHAALLTPSPQRARGERDSGCELI